jgi:hypothetical protein
MVVADAEVSEEQALRLVAEAAATALGETDLAKALKHPLAQVDRARARQEFLALQRDFATILDTEIENSDVLYEQLGDIAGRATEMGRRAQTVITAHHRFARARINPTMRQCYLRAFELGLRAGGAGRGMLDNESRLVERTRANEYAYLDNFITDLEHREGSMAYDRRAELYANALEETYWMGYVYADQSPDRYVRWATRVPVPDRGEIPCPDCAYMAGDWDSLLGNGIAPRNSRIIRYMGFPPGGRWGSGVYQAQELARLGVFPQSGALACTTNCHCRLVQATRPEGAPQSAPAKRLFRSLQPKAFTGTRQRKDGGTTVTRTYAHTKRRGYAKRAKQTEQRYHPRKGRAR